MSASQACLPSLTGGN